MSSKRLLTFSALAFGWLVVMFFLPTSLVVASTGPQPANPNLPLPPGRAFTAANSEGAVWLTPGPRPELWVITSGKAPRLVLHGESQHFSTPRWSPDGRHVAVLAVPTGSETAALGKWWVVNLDDVGERHQVEVPPDWVQTNASQPGMPTTSLRTPAASQAPVPSNATGTAALTPPATIRVAHHPDNSCRALPDWAVTVIPFEEYVARVLPAEVYTTWPEAALQAQAVAIRTYAWRKVLLAPPDAPYDITDWAVDQAMCDARYPSTDAAVMATAGRYLAYAGGVILAQYSAENGHPTLDGGRPYLQPVLDPVSLGQARSGHGHGLSQWGAYRWAAQHDWNATQILTHYYTGVQIIDTVGGDPSLSLLTPWPGTWLTGATAYLAAHAATETVSALTFQMPGLTVRDTTPADGWGVAWPIPDVLTRPVTVTAGTGVLTHTISLAGEDRQPPAGQIDLPASTPTLTVTLHISATDRGASGLAGVTAGGDWQVRAEDFQRETGGGMLISDPNALSGRALVLPPGVASRWGATLSPALAVDQLYQAYVRLRIAGNSPTADANVRSDDCTASLWDFSRLGSHDERLKPLLQVATLHNPYSPTSVRVEIYDPANNILLGFVDLRPGDLRYPNIYQEFPVDFWLSPEASGGLGVRLIADGDVEVALDRVRVLAGPQPFQPELPYVLAQRAGPQAVVVKLLDAAGNPSADLTGMTELIDVTPPGDWQLIRPGGWVTTTLHPLIAAHVTDDISGIALESAAARVTTDAGVSWTAWQPVTATLEPGLAAELHLVWPGGEGGGGNRVQFRASDGAGWSSVSPGWPVRVDLTPPVAHAELSGIPNASGWITAPVTLTLWAEDVGSGVAGMWYALDDAWRLYAAPLPFAGEGCLRAGYRAQDRAGLDSPAGEITWQLDTVPPTTTLTAPQRVTTGTPILVTWSGRDGIGVVAFDVQVSPGSGLWKDWLQDTTVTAAKFPALGPGTLWLRARSRDPAGNIGAWSTPRPVSVDNAVLFLPLVLSRGGAFAKHPVV